MCLIAYSFSLQMEKRLVDVFVAVSFNSGKNKVICDNLVDYKQLIIRRTQMRSLDTLPGIE